jgi:pimeloyl-ACP methyl ester carboxylesterase
VLGGICSGILQASSIFEPVLDIHGQNPTLGANRGPFERWLARRQRELDADSKVIETAAGPIEYKKRGSGPAVICLHGAFEGYDASFRMGENLVSKGFTVIGVSRPGYLRTPLSVGESAVEQAEAMMALMDSLGIDQAAVIGFSAGTLPAFQMAVLHPDRIWACVLEGVGSHPDDAQPGGLYDQMRLIISDDDLVEPLDIATWILYTTARDDIKLTAETVLRTDVVDAMPDTELEQRIRFVKRSFPQSDFLKRFCFSLTPYSLRRDGIYNDIKDAYSIDPWQDWVDAGILQDVTVPVQIIQGVWDSSGNHGEAKNLIAPNIPTANLVSVQGTGHFLWLGKNTTAWEKLMLSFLKNNAPR